MDVSHSILAAAIATLSLTATQPARAYDPAADLASNFSSTPTNPNGVWSYGYDDVLTFDYNFKPFSAVSTNSSLMGWHAPSYSLGGLIPSVANSLVNVGWIVPGQMLLHPGPDVREDAAILRFTAPGTAVYNVSLTLLSGDSGETEGWIVLSGAFGSPLASLGITTTPILGAVAISLIGLANIVGSITAGWLGNRYSKKYLLAGIYTARTIVATLFILIPMTPVTVLVFSVAMGSLWLATVPLTSGLVAHIYGLRYMGTLYGFVFLSHQLGSFLGVWLGGLMYDISGNYTAVWWVGIGVGAFSAIVHLPKQERPSAAQDA